MTAAASKPARKPVTAFRGFPSLVDCPSADLCSPERTGTAVCARRIDHLTLYFESAGPASNLIRFELFPRLIAAEDLDVVAGPDGCRRPVFRS